MRPAWHSLLRTGSNGAPITDVANVLIALREDETYGTAFSFNEMAAVSLVTRSEPVPVTDDVVTEVQEYLQLNGLPRIADRVVGRAIEHLARERSFHPVRDYLNGLTHDGIERLGRWTTDYLGAEDNAYSSRIGLMFVIAMVARIYDPGCKADYMLILEGPQGIGKSTALKTLASEAYFSDSLYDFEGGKDVLMHLNGKWLIELGELHALSRAESTLIKQILSSTHDKFRPPYAHYEVNHPRGSLFAGTSNKNSYLRDETGGRRFWPLPCGTIDIAALERDRDQLLAEAVVAYRDKVQWWPDRDFERDHIAPEQDARFEEDAWTSTIRANLKGHTRTTIMEVARGLQIDPSRLDMAQQRRIGASLRAIGWELKHTKHGNFWIAPGTMV